MTEPILLRPVGAGRNRSPLARRTPRLTRRARLWEITKEEKMSDEDQILSRTEVLALLSQKAREGSTSAMIALERALRIGQDEPPDEDDFIGQLIQSGIRRDEASRQREGRAA